MECKDSPHGALTAGQRFALDHFDHEAIWKMLPISDTRRDELYSQALATQNAGHGQEHPAVGQKTHLMKTRNDPRSP